MATAGKKTKPLPEDAEESEARKSDEEVLKHLRGKVPIKTAQIKGNKVEYFAGSKAIDCLMESKWAQALDDNASTNRPYFPTRAAAVLFCNRLLRRGYFVGGQKVEVKSKKESTDQQQDNDVDDTSGMKQRRKTTDSPRPKADAKKSSKKRFRLDWKDSRAFQDGDELYIWQYEHTSKLSYVLGGLVVLGVIAFTLQPLWPESSRVGIWYLGVFLGVLLGILILLYIVRWFLWGIVLTLSYGKISFWLLPNLDNEKLGIIDSFKPLYSLERKKKSGKKSKTKKQAEDTKTDSSQEDNGKQDDEPTNTGE